MRSQLRWGVIVVAVALAYANSFSVPFLFDDKLAIVENPTIRSLWPPWLALCPPAQSGITVSGRPILNATFAVNYAVTKLQVGGYHLVNLAIHISAALVLFGIVRRTLSLPIFAGRFEKARNGLAVMCALLWGLHPIQTVAVTYLAQRAESLASLWYLLILYAFVRSLDNGAAHHLRWRAASIACCFAGVATKEILVTAPIAVLLFDRCLVAGTFRAALVSRWRYYLGLISSWILLAWLMSTTGDRGGYVGLGVIHMWWPFALTQIQAVIGYVGLLLWPSPLIFDYGETLVRSFSAVVLQAGILALLLSATLFALWKKPPAGFAAFWFFLLLAPTSTVVPSLVQAIAEHRVYLASAGPICLAVVCLYLWCGRFAWPILAGLAVALAVATVHRNSDYRSEVAIWRDTAKKRPENARALNNLGGALTRLGQTKEAEQCYREAIRRDPTSAIANQNLALLLAKSGRRPEAYGYFQEALTLNPRYAEAWCNFGNTFLVEGDLDEAMRCYHRCLQVDPGYAEAHNNLGVALVQKGGRSAEAAEEFRQALRLRPGYPDAVRNLERLSTSPPADLSSSPRE